MAEDRNIIRQSNRSTQSGTIKMKAKNLPKVGAFPIFLFPLAILKDIFDIFDISIIGVIFTTISSFFVWALTAQWLWGKGGFIRKQLWKRLWSRIILIATLDFLPIFKIFVGASMLILMVFSTEKKIVKQAAKKAKQSMVQSYKQMSNK